jgi:uncharacterized protein HemX
MEQLILSQLGFGAALVGLTVWKYGQLREQWLAHAKELEALQDRQKLHEQANAQGMARLEAQLARMDRKLDRLMERPR